MLKARQYIEELLEPADVRLNGERPWDLKIYNSRFYRRVIRQGSLGLGESYMEGWWEADALDQFFYRILTLNLQETIPRNPAVVWLRIKSLLTNYQKKSKAFEVGEHHYDIGNDLYRVMLDRRMVYTCAYWKGAKTLDKAQEMKLERVCRKLDLKPGSKVLDIGCGWGSFAKFAAERYGAHVVGITVSEKQAELAREMCSGLPVEIRLQDYRDLDEKFDHIVSLGMIEHVGSKNYKEYFRVVHRCLHETGCFLLQTIGSPIPVRDTDPWIHKYIFPNSMIPSVSQLSDAFERRFVMEDWENFGADYDTTLMAWFKNFEEGWGQLRHTYSEKFYRMWKYYLMVSAASFRARDSHLWQVLFSKNGIPGGYSSDRFQAAKGGENGDRKIVAAEGKKNTFAR